MNVLGPPRMKPHTVWLGLFLGLLCWAVIGAAFWLVWTVIE